MREGARERIFPLGPSCSRHAGPKQVSLGLQGGSLVSHGLARPLGGFSPQAVAQLPGEASPLNPRGRDGRGSCCLAQGPAEEGGPVVEFSIWVCFLSQSAPPPQFQLFSLLRSQKCTTDPCSSPTLPLPGCVTLGRSPLLSESLAQKRGVMRIIMDI